MINILNQLIEEGSVVKIKSFCIAFLLSSLGLAHSAYALKTAPGKIIKMKAQANKAFVYVPGLNDPFNCGNTDLAVLQWSTAGSDKLWSMLLAAQMYGKRVSFEGSCQAGRLSIEAVYLKS
jgi:hypothetical protein